MEDERDVGPVRAAGRPYTPPGEERPRFRDLSPEEVSHPETNPYLAAHREFGRELVPAGEAWRYHGRWQDFFGRDGPLVVEVGSGIGDWLVELAAAQPGCDHVGIEIRYKRCMLIARRIRRAGIANAVAVRYHAGFLDDLFAPGSVDALWLNHPDPWPRDRHVKHRLVTEWFLADCARVLRPGAPLYLRTDADHHIDALDAMLPSAPFERTGQVADIAQQGAPWWPSHPTHYQRKMSALGRRVHGVALRRR